ncbi:branched-chain amino acid ABC transporter permease [Roseiarcaceae bacterium H3SJ34-1]|uniref:branched-chain amino acid ABC transporter permease n=1 Tax=Terripilifer ovatus TaxID=3032367 RepID=UPI003AB96237|nr:branched-chain amino acid ABC transporter permease [Roseiarcaceae bacterium H3SJ34-1]
MNRLETRGVLLFLALAALAPLVITDQFFIHVMVMVFFYAILASSLNLTVGFVGELSLGHAAFLGIGAYASAILSTEYGLPALACIPVAGLLAALAGLVIGLITLHLEGHFFVLITLAFAEVLRLIVNNWIEVTRGPLGFSSIPPPRLSIGGHVLMDFSSRVQFYYLALAVLAVTIGVVLLYAQSAFRVGAVAVRENRRLAKAVGIDPFRQALLTFVIGAFLAGMAGSFYAHYITFVGPEVFGFSFMVTMLMMVALGGKGTVLGPLLGALLIGVALEYLRFINEIRLSVFGILLILVTMYLPQGAIGLLAWRRMRKAGIVKVSAVTR